MASLLSIGVTGLRVNQTALQVTGNNISNADIESYTRQRTEIVTGSEQFTGGGYIGSGSTVETISRIADQFLTTQIILDSSTYNSVSAYSENVEQLDSLLAGELSSLSSGIASMFSAVEVSIEDPTSLPSRQLVLSEAQGLTDRIQTIYDRLSQQSDSVNEQLASLTVQVTTLAQGIAELNEAILRETATGASPNALLDARDDLIGDLSELISVRTTDDSSGAVNVFVGSGQPLVVGVEASTMGVQASTTIAGEVDITFSTSSGSPLVVTSAISGGQLGGLLEFRDESLEPAFNAIGRISLALSDTMNQVNQQGLDLEGNFGSLIFTDVNSAQLMLDRSIASSASTGTAELAVSIQDVSGLTEANYSLDIISTGVPITATLTNEISGEVISGTFVDTDHDNDVLTADVSLFTPADPSKTEGLGIYVDSGSLATGDTFYIRPTRDGGNSVEVAMLRAQELAYASPMVTGASLDNSGSAEISAGEVLEAFDRYGNPSPAFAAADQLSPPITINFTSATTYEVYDSTDPTALSLLFTGTYTQGESNPVFPTDSSTLNYQGYQVELSGSPVAGDTFTVGYNEAGISDSRNGVALSSLRVEGTMDGGSLNFEDAYGSLVETIGADTVQHRISLASAEALLAFSVANRSSVSGVNLDEEAANLIKFEQAYNANAQVISVARQIFDTLMNAF